MHKPDQLRDWLLRSVKGLGDAPEKLHMFIDEGRVEARRGSSLSYLYRYQLTIMVEDWAHGSEHLFVPILVWAAKNEPDLLDESGNISFDKDIIDNKLSDFDIRLNLTEPVIVSSNDDGGWAVSYPGQPAFPPAFAAAPESRLSALWLNGLRGLGERFLAAGDE